MGKAYLDQQWQRYQQMFNLGVKEGYQQYHDFLTLVLTDPQFIGENTFDKEQLILIKKGMDHYLNLYAPAFEKHPDSDYYQEKLDANLREIYEDLFCPFKVRHPMIRQYSYDKPQKGWVK